MKRIAVISLVLLIVCSVCACAKDETPDITTQPTTATTPTAPVTVNPYTKFKIVLAAYSDYAQNVNSPLPIEQIIFKDNDGCYITPIEDRIFTFFEEGAIEANQIFSSGNFTLYKAADLEDVMLQAMNNAWNSYAAQCAENHTDVGELSMYLFKCDHFEGVYGIGNDGRLVQNLVLEGNSCGQFGAFQIYLPENINNSQENIMSDADRMVQIRNVYTKYVTEVALDGQSYEPIQSYIFEFNDNYFRIDEWIYAACKEDAGELASSKDYDGWHIYHAKVNERIPTPDVIKNAYNAFVVDAASNNLTYDEMIAYIYFDGQTYFITDEWLNVLPVEEENIEQLVGKLASDEAYHGLTLYLHK